MPTTTSRPTLPALAVRPLAQLSAARARRAADRRLRAELATYRTTAERAELAALLERQPADDASLVAGALSAA
jgi:hypothetical protein